jgi:transcriptional regulator with XRE-family HTH domain
MRPQELRAARLERGWGQTEVASRLGVSQAYVNMLEKGKRRLTSEMTRKFANVYCLSPTKLPVSEAFKPLKVDAQRLAENLGKLGYPGFAYLHSHLTKKNPGEVLLTALFQNSLEARVAEALPWLLLRYWQMGSDWLVDEARKLNLQNRLGFVVSLARLVSEKHPPQNAQRSDTLGQLEATLNTSRLANEDAFYRPPRTDGEREWLLQNRSDEARHWNLLTDLRPEHLQYVE